MSNTPLKDLAHLASEIGSLADQVYLELAEDNGKRTKYYDPTAWISHAMDLWMKISSLRIFIDEAINKK